MAFFSLLDNGGPKLARLPTPEKAASYFLPIFGHLRHVNHKFRHQAKFRHNLFWLEWPQGTITTPYTAFKGNLRPEAQKPPCGLFGRAVVHPTRRLLVLYCYLTFPDKNAQRPFASGIS